MNQATHAWLAVEAYRKIKMESEKNESLIGLRKLLGEHLGDVVVGSWLPDSLIKDMTYGHVFKNSEYPGDQKKRFTLDTDGLKKVLPKGSQVPAVAFPGKADPWWKKPYRVKENGGHLPARVNAISQSIRDMLKMGDDDVMKMSGAMRSDGAEEITKSYLYSPRDIALMMWIQSHYVADAHMPFHSDNRALASTAKCATHSKVEDVWGENVPAFFKKTRLLRSEEKGILSASYPNSSCLKDIDFGEGIPPLKGGDPWAQAVYICRAGFAVSFSLVSADIAPVDSRNTVTFEKMLTALGEEKFRLISRAIMHDAVNAIAMFWVDAWSDFLK
jgi:hypothetical protein